MPAWWEQQSQPQQPQQPAGLPAMDAPPAADPFDEHLAAIMAWKPTAALPTPALPSPRSPGLMSDAGNLLKLGYAGTAQGINWLASKTPGLKDIPNNIIDLQGNVDYWKEAAANAGQALSPEQQAADKKQFINDDYSMGDAWGDWRSYAGGAIESIPGTIAGMAVGGPITKGLAALGGAVLPKLGIGLATEAATGAAASKALPRLTEKAVERLTMGSGAVGYGFGEGLIAAGSDGAAARDLVMANRQLVEQSSPLFKQLTAQGYSPEESLLRIADTVAQQVATRSGLTVGVLGAPMGAVFGKWFHGAGGERIGKSALGAMGIGAGGEALQEFPQSGFEQFYQNQAMQDYVDPNQPLMAGVWDASAKGAIAGGLMGGLMGGAGHFTQGQTPQGLPSPDALPVEETALSTPGGIVPTPLPDNEDPMAAWIRQQSEQQDYVNQQRPPIPLLDEVLGGSSDSVSAELESMGFSRAPAPQGLPAPPASTDPVAPVAPREVEKAALQNEVAALNQSPLPAPPAPRRQLGQGPLQAPAIPQGMPQGQAEPSELVRPSDELNRLLGPSPALPAAPGQTAAPTEQGLNDLLTRPASNAVASAPLAAQGGIAPPTAPAPRPKVRQAENKEGQETASGELEITDHRLFPKIADLPNQSLTDLEAINHRVELWLSTYGDTDALVHLPDGSKVRTIIPYRQTEPVKNYQRALEALVNRARQAERTPKPSSPAVADPKIIARQEKLSAVMAERQSEVDALIKSVQAKREAIRQQALAMKNDAAPNQGKLKELAQQFKDGEEHLFWLKNRAFEATDENGGAVNPMARNAGLTPISSEIKNYVATSSTPTQETPNENGKAETKTEALLNLQAPADTSVGDFIDSRPKGLQKIAAKALQADFNGASRAEQIRNAIAGGASVVKTAKGRTLGAWTEKQLTKHGMDYAEALAPPKAVPVAAAKQKEPWEMTQNEWGLERSALRPDNTQSNFTRQSTSEAVRRADDLEKLLYGINDVARGKLKEAQEKKITLSQQEVDDLLEQINTPVNHRRVIEKALTEGKPVPAEVLADYPDLVPKGAVGKPAAPVAPDKVERPVNPKRRYTVKNTATNRLLTNPLTNQAHEFDSLEQAQKWADNATRNSSAISANRGNRRYEKFVVVDNQVDAPVVSDKPSAPAESAKPTKQRTSSAKRDDDIPPEFVPASPAKIAIADALRQERKDGKIDTLTLIKKLADQAVNNDMPLGLLYNHLQAFNDWGEGQVATALYDAGMSSADLNDLGFKAEAALAKARENRRKDRSDQKFSAATPASLTAQLKTLSSDATVQALINNGRLNLVAKQTELPRSARIPPSQRVAGWVDPQTGVVYLVTDNITQAEVDGLLSHEIGVHQSQLGLNQPKPRALRLAHALVRLLGGRAILGDPAFEQVLKQMEQLRAAGNVRVVAAFEDAQKAAGKLNQSPALLQEEALAYLVQNQPQLPLVRRIMAAIRAMLYRMGLKISLTEADLRSLAQSAVRRAALTPLNAAPQRAAQSWQDVEAQRQYDAVVSSYTLPDGSKSPEWMKAPNGQPTKLNERQWVQTRTENFKQWFDGSKVVDENGDPLVVYHGTAADIAEFKRENKYTDFGVHFGDLSHAEARSRTEERSDSAIYPAFLSIKNPIRLDDARSWFSPFWVMEESGIQPYLTQEIIQQVNQSLKQIKEQSTQGASQEELGKTAAVAINAMRNHLIANGYDGIVYENTRDGARRFEHLDSWIAFDPTQIKSAIGNTGAFSPMNPDIRYAQSIAETEPNLSPAELLKRIDAGGEVTPAQWQQIQEYLRAAAQPVSTGNTLKAWFGASKITDKAGKPLKMYHGTAGQFNAFDAAYAGGSTTHPTAALGFFFTDNQEHASLKYAGSGGNVLEVYLAVEKPYIMTDRDLRRIESIEDATAFRKRLEDQGYDGVIMPQEVAGTRYVAAFYPDQIKLTSNETFTRGEQDVRFATAWHGTPHTFEAEDGAPLGRFRMEKLGTGEGAQVFGHGLYFTEKRKIGEGYRDSLSAAAPAAYEWRGHRYEDGPIKHALSLIYNDGLPYTRKLAKQWANDAANNADEKAYFQTLLDTVNNVGSKSEIKQHKGRLYQAHLKPADDSWLLWDKPLTAQSKRVKAAIEGNALLKSLAAERKEDGSQKTGEDLYRELSSKQGGDQAASDYLATADIPGMKYLTGDSRAKGKGDYNYVVFRDGDVEVMQRFALARPQPAPGTPPQVAPPPMTRVEMMQRAIQDKFVRLKTIQNWLKQIGINLTPDADVYGAEERSVKRFAAKAEDFRKQTVRPLVQAAGKAGYRVTGGDLIGALMDRQPLPTTFKPSIPEYLIARHAPKRNASIAKINPKYPDGGSGLTNAQAAAIMAKYQALPDFAGFAQQAEQFSQISEGTKKLLLSAGLLSADQVAAWDAAYGNTYVPLMGGPEDAPAHQGTGPGQSVNARQRRALGHDLREENVIENIFRARERALFLIEKNPVGLALRELLLQTNNPNIGTVGQPEKKAVLAQGWVHEVWVNGRPLGAYASYNDAKAAIAADSATTGRLVKDYGVRHKASDPSVIYMTPSQLADNEATVYLNGERIRMQINDPDAARAYNALGVDAATGLIKAGATFNRYLSKAYTGFNPEFLAVNIARDLTAGLINLTGKYGAGFAAKAIKNYLPAMRETWRFARDKGNHAWVDRYRAAGGSTGAAYLSDLERLGTDLTHAFQDAQGAAAVWKEGKKGAALRVASADMVQRAFGWLERMNMAGENAMRVATFRAVIEAGGTDAEAASAAANVTVNFNRRGEMGQQLSALYLFFNPNVQGTQVLLDTLLNSPHKAQAWAAAGALAGLAFALAGLARGGDDEDEKKWRTIPAQVKDRNLILKMGDEQITIPVPFGYGVFWSLGNILSDLAHGADDGRAGYRLASALFQHFSPIGNPLAGDEADFKGVGQLLPTVARMPMEVALNRSGLGSPIRPETPAWNPGQPDSQAKWRSSSGNLYDRFAVGMNRLTGGSAYESGFVDVSPETWNAIVRDLTGGAGQFVADSLNLGATIAQGGTPTIKELPIVRKFVREETIQDTRTYFHDQAQQVKIAIGAFNAAKRAKDRAGVMSIAHDKAELIRLGSILNATNKLIQAQRMAQQQILAGDDLLPVKWARLKAMEAQEAAIYDRFDAIFIGATARRQDSGGGS